MSSDQLVDGGMLPRRRDDAGPFHWPGAMRSRFFDGFHRSIAAMAGAGNNLLVDHIIEYAAWRAQLSDLLRDFDVFLVGVHCDLDELARRERTRRDRRTGEARAHLRDNRIHEFGPYDVAVDTTHGVTSELVEHVRTAWTNRHPDGNALSRAATAANQGATRPTGRSG